MARKINKGLSKQELEDMGIYSIYWDDDKNNWTILREWYDGGSKNKTIKEVTIQLSVTNHKYSNRVKKYPIIVMGYNGKSKSFPLARVIYCWFVEDIIDGYVIDHINNNPFDNSIDNLQMITPEENLRKRFEDREIVYRNQYEAMRLEFREEPEPKTTFVDFAAFGDD